MLGSFPFFDFFRATSAAPRVGKRTMHHHNESGWFLPWHCVNKPQIESIERLLELAKHAHMVDVRVRINGQDKWFEVDWLKHLERVTPTPPVSRSG